MSLHLTESNQKILFGILNKYKSDYTFIAFGSRVRGTHHQYSDLDIAVIDHNKKGLTKIKDELEESELSITIDLIDFDTLSNDFKKLIKDEQIIL